MSLRFGAKRLYREFNKGVSYKSGDIGDKLIDAQNMLIIQNKLQTRPGLKKFTSEALPAAPNSLSFYKLDSGVSHVIAKAGTVIKESDPDDGVFATIKSGLTSTTKHDALTVRGRHILAVESDGLFSYNGTTFAELGVTPPTAPTVVATNGAGTLTDKTYRVCITYECETTGFESNAGTDSGTVSTSGGNDGIDVSAIPVSTHALVTHKNIYLKNTTDGGAYLYVATITNATTTYTIAANPASTAASPPTDNDTPVAGGAKYLALFNSQVVSAGNSTYPSDIFFANTDEPDGWSTDNPLVHVNGEGPITGLAVGYYQGATDLNQYLVGFKKRHITIYFQSINDAADDMQIDIPGVGCVSHKTIKVKDGNVYFLSDFGWRIISNGKLVEENLGKGDIDDIFRINGFTYGVNKQQLQNAFAVYYSELDAYMCWVSEGSSSSFTKCYVWHMDVEQWMPQTMGLATCACTGEDENGEETVYLGNLDNHVYDFSIRNTHSDDATTQGFVLDVDQLDIDELESDSSTSIPIFALFNWQPNEDFDATYNFRDLIIEAIGDASSALSTATIKAYLNFSRSSVFTYTYDFYRQEGFTLDVSMLDVDILGDDRTRGRIASDLNKTAQNIMIGVYQDVILAKLQLLAYQLNFSKNGNRNI